MNNRYNLLGIFQIEGWHPKGYSLVSCAELVWLGPFPINSAALQVALHGGAPNKNIGDAFLLVWKFPKGCTVEDIARVTSVPDTKEHEASIALASLL